MQLCISRRCCFRQNPPAKRQDPEEGLHITGGVQSTISGPIGQSFVGRATSPTYSDALLKLEGPSDRPHHQYNFLELSTSGNTNSRNPLKNVFSVASNGRIHTAGGLVSESDVSLEAQLKINGGLKLKRTSVRASDKIVVPDSPSLSFLEVTDDGRESANEVVIEGSSAEGQMLLVKNSDQQSLAGVLGFVPPDSMLLYTFLEPRGWTDVTATAAHKRELSGITSLQALNDLDIGNHALSCEHLLIKSKADPEHLGKLALFGPGGRLIGDGAAAFDIDKKTLQVNGLIAKQFLGDSLDFLGAAIKNADLVNATLDGLQHLTVDRMGVRSLAYKGRGSRMALIDEKGGLSATENVRWDNKKRELKLSAISAFSPSGLEVRTDLDMASHTLRNFKIEANTTLQNLRFHDGVIEDTVLRNVTATGLSLGSVKMESLALSSLGSNSNIGALLSVGKDGTVVPAEDMIRSSEGKFAFERPVMFAKDIDFNGKAMSNVEVTSGNIRGDSIDVEVRSISADSINLLPVKRNKSDIGESLATFDEQGALKRSAIAIEDGWLGDIKVAGKLDFGRGPGDNDATAYNRRRGRILNAFIEGGSIIDLETLSVQGETHIGEGLNVQGETFINGGLTVSGPVLGSGPYVDVSDKRLKKNIRQISDENILKKLLQLEGVEYELDLAAMHGKLGTKIGDDDGVVGESSFFAEEEHASENRQYGFIAQNVEDIFPQLVVSGEDGYKGLQYARFVPILERNAS